MASCALSHMQDLQEQKNHHHMKHKLQEKGRGDDELLFEICKKLNKYITKKAGM